jgi:hypothetical protein
LLPYSPELNPCERVFEWLRAKIEGEMYISLQHKRHTIEQHLRRLSLDKYNLQQRVGWEWIREAFTFLPDIALVNFRVSVTNLSLDKREGRDASSVNRPMVEELRYDNQNFYHRAA